MRKRRPLTTQSRDTAHHPEKDGVFPLCFMKNSTIFKDFLQSCYFNIPAVSVQICTDDEPESLSFLGSAVDPGSCWQLLTSPLSSCQATRRWKKRSLAPLASLSCSLFLLIIDKTEKKMFQLIMGTKTFIQTCSNL